MVWLWGTSSSIFLGISAFGPREEPVTLTFCNCHIPPSTPFRHCEVRQPHFHSLFTYWHVYATTEYSPAVRPRLLTSKEASLATQLLDTFCCGNSKRVHWLPSHT